MSDRKVHLDEISVMTEADENPMLQQSAAELMYEKKSAMINREIDAIGIGPYQWATFVLCGFGYLLDLMWANGISLVAPPLQAEFGFSDEELGNLFVAFSLGLTVGAFVWGLLVDIIGRKWAFNLTVLVTSICGFCIGFVNTYLQLMFLTTLLGFGVGGNIPVDTTIVLEVLPNDWRFLLEALSVFQPLGVLISCIVGFLLIPTYSCNLDLPACSSPEAAETGDCCRREDNRGWRYVAFTLGSVSIVVFISRYVFFNFKESPKFYVQKGQNDKAIVVLQSIAKKNKKHCGLTEADLELVNLEINRRQLKQQQHQRTGATEQEDENPVLLPCKEAEGVPVQTSTSSKWKNKLAAARKEWQRIETLFATSTMRRLTIVTWIICFFDFWSFTLAGQFLPTILVRKGLEISNDTRSTYRKFVIIYSFGILGAILSALIIKMTNLSRRFMMMVSSALMGISLLLFCAIDSNIANIAFNSLEYFFQTIFNAILYAYMSEAFPSPIRGTACGLASCWGRFGSVLAPFAGAQLLERTIYGVLYMASAFALVCTVSILFLPSGIKLNL